MPRLMKSTVKSVEYELQVNIALSNYALHSAVKFGACKYVSNGLDNSLVRAQSCPVTLLQIPFCSCAVLFTSAKKARTPHSI